MIRAKQTQNSQFLCHFDFKNLNFDKRYHSKKKLSDQANTYKIKRVAVIVVTQKIPVFSCLPCSKWQQSSYQANNISQLFQSLLSRSDVNSNIFSFFYRSLQTCLTCYFSGFLVLLLLLFHLSLTFWSEGTVWAQNTIYHRGLSHHYTGLSCY